MQSRDDEIEQRIAAAESHFQSLQALQAEVRQCLARTMDQEMGAELQLRLEKIRGELSVACSRMQRLYCEREALAAQKSCPSDQERAPMAASGARDRHARFFEVSVTMAVVRN
jgi:hypothetical protein